MHLAFVFNLVTNFLDFKWKRTPVEPERCQLEILGTADFLQDALLKDVFGDLVISLELRQDQREPGAEIKE